MSIYRRKRQSGKRSKYYTAEFEYRRKLYRRSGFVDRDQAKDWISTETNKLRRGETGYVKPMHKAQVIPLMEQFTQHLAANGRDDKYCQVALYRLVRLAGEAGWLTLGHVTGASLEEWKSRPSLYRKNPVGNRTRNQFVAIAREWCRWLVKPMGKLPSNPLADVSALPAKHNDAYRRAGTVDELNTLLASCGESRRLYYLFRIYTPMRADTIGNLTWRMMHLDATPPFAKTPAEINKSRKEQKHTIRYDVAQELRKVKRKAKADDLVFPNPPTLDDLRDDLKKAGVAFDDGKGNDRLDFHALRATLVDLGKHAGLTAFQVMELLGHKNINTTMKYYNKRSVAPELGAAMEKLPTLGKVRKA